MNKVLLITMSLLAAVFTLLFFIEDKGVVAKKELDQNSNTQAAYIFGKAISEKALKGKTNQDKESYLAMLIEGEMQNHLPSEYNINASDEKVEAWLRSKKPDIYTKNILGINISNAAVIYKSLLSVHDDSLTTTEAFNTQINKLMKKEAWDALVVQFSSDSSLKLFKSEVDKSHEERLRESIKIYRREYLLEKAQVVNCDKLQVREKIDAALAKKVVEYSQHSSLMGRVPEMMKRKEIEYCRVFSLGELVNLQKNNVTLINKDYSDALSKTTSFKLFEFHKKVLP